MTLESFSGTHQIVHTLIYDPLNECGGNREGSEGDLGTVCLDLASNTIHCPLGEFRVLESQADPTGAGMWLRLERAGQERLASFVKGGPYKPGRWSLLVHNVNQCGNATFAFQLSIPKSDTTE